ncbi:MAG: conjugative transposon protein TraM [Bacteroidetes bacterium 43-16]|nr:MAG: conjugative transposon protein TraM [Bacteroidetes bacterium 43-16]
MNNEQTMQIEERKKKFFLVLPLFAVPFLTLLFFLMGGGTAESNGAIKEDGGFNSLLPDAKKGEVDAKDKLASYEQAKQDSFRRSEAAKQDPYFSGAEDADGFGTDEFGGLSNDGLTFGGSYNRVNEDKIYSRLAEINKSLEQSKGFDEPERFQSSYRRPAYGTDPEIQSLRQDISNLESLMQHMQSGTTEADPEMEQINTVLQSVLDIQHPERVQERLQKESAVRAGQVLAVSEATKELPLTLLDNKSAMHYARAFEANLSGKRNSFHGLHDDDHAGSISENGIAAVIHEDQTVVNGSTVKLRLASAVTINGSSIPKDHFIYGVASLRGERLEIDIASIRFVNSLFPVSLSVHDMDGLAGVHIPGAITRDVVKQNSEQSLQSMNFGPFNPSLGAQAASAGIELGKNLFSRKVKLVKVSLKAGYQVLLKDNKRKEN